MNAARGFSAARRLSSRATVAAISVALWWQASSAAGQLPASLKVELAPQQVEIGDRVDATLTLVWMGEQPTSSPRFPSWQESWGIAEILDSGPVEAFTDQSGRHIYRQKLELIVFEAGETELPEISIAVPLADETVDVESSDPITLTVSSVLPDEQTEEPLEPRPAFAPRQLDTDDLSIWASVALAIAIVAIALIWARRIRGTIVPSNLEVILGPLPELEHHLGTIRLDDGAELAHTTLSHALRLFLGRSFAFPAVESTTSQIQGHLRTTGLTADDAIEAMRVLRACDLVKFAKREVEPALTADRIVTVRGLGQRVDEHLSVPAEENEGGHPS